MRPLFYTVSLVVLAAGLLGQTIKQDPSDTVTPAALKPGSPAGAYDLTSWESINVHNGKLNVKFPLLKIGGRGEAGYTMFAQATLPPLTVEVSSTTDPDGGGTGTLRQTFNVGLNSKFWYEGKRVGYGAGLMFLKRVASGPVVCGQNDPAFSLTFTHLVFVDAEGTEHTFYDPSSFPSPRFAGGCTGGIMNRGRVFKTVDGSGMVFTATQNVLDEYLVSAYPALEVSLVSGTLVTRTGVTYTINGLVHRFIKQYPD